MRKSLWISSLIVSFILLAFLAFTVSIASPDGLFLTAPATCPSSGCAAGQRLNFTVEFSVDPMYTSGPNTQVCIYVLKDGQGGSGSSPWADFSHGWISTDGGTYTSGETASVCSNNSSTSDTYVAGVFATHPGPTIEDIDFALNINPTTDIDGYVKVKIFQVDSSGSTWPTSDQFTKDIDVAEIDTQVFVGQSAEECGSNSPCFMNSGDDDTEGLGTGLRDAVMAIQAGAEIVILEDYPIKNETVLIDKNLTISGNDGSLITYIGATCSNPMLKFENGGLIQDISINDGNCPANSSRTLIEVDSPADVAIEHNTLSSGDYAINIQDNTGTVTAAFNQIQNNHEEAVYRAGGSAGSGKLSLYANNLLNNGDVYQVRCNDLGDVNHNYWGEGELPANNAYQCAISNGKRLGAPILLSNSGAGVEALRKNVTTSMTYAFNNKIGVRHNSGGNDFDVIIVNHGQGNEDNIPFFESGSEAIQACSNFYDVFLSDDAAASNLEIALKYDLDSECISTIESEDYCLSSGSSDFPLWWYDPANDVTDGWDKTGQSPQGVGAGGASGQTTTCDLADNEIHVKIDNSGRPGISTDVNFTPFIAGLPITEGAEISQFTASFDIDEVDLQWITTGENKVRGFYVIRSNTEDGTYSRISTEIEAIGDTFIGGIYLFSDSDITFDRDYFYKIQVINEQGQTIATHGPAIVLTSTPTPTTTQTYTPYPTRTTYPSRTLYPSRTPYPSRTATRYYYRSPTSNYRPSTSTPRSNPTQARTAEISPTGSQTLAAIDRTAEYDDSGYPVDGMPAGEAIGYPNEEDADDSMRVTTPIPPGHVGSDDEDTEINQAGQTSPGAGEEFGQGIQQPNMWLFLVLGAVGSIFLTLIISIILAKSHLK